MPTVEPDPTTEIIRHEQPEMEEVQPLCTRGILLGPSGSGKGVLLQWLITQAYRFPAVKRVYVWSPSVDLAPEWEVVRRYSKEVLGVDQDREKTFFSEFRAEGLQEVIDTQEAVISYMRKSKQKAAWPNILLVFDDLADSPEFMRREKLLHRLSIRGRWASISTLVSTQVWRALAPECRKQATAVYCFRLRNQADLDGLVEELAAVHPKGKKGILELYRRATSEQFGFLYCDLMQRDPDLMFKDKQFRSLTDKRPGDEERTIVPLRGVPGQSR